MKKVLLSILLLISIPLLLFAGFYIHAVYFHKVDPATQAYMDEEDPERKMELLEGILNKDPYSRWARLDDAAQLAYEIGDYDKASAYAMEALALSSHYQNDWNHGNAIHNANMVLGRLSLKEGDVEKARTYLLASAQSTGSPQLDTFGPSLKLANELLIAGEEEAVVSYLDSISGFWDMDNGCVKRWINQIENHQTPELCRCRC